MLSPRAHPISGRKCREPPPTAPEQIEWGKLPGLYNSSPAKGLQERENLEQITLAFISISVYDTWGVEVDSVWLKEGGWQGSRPHQQLVGGEGKEVLQGGGCGERVHNRVYNIVAEYCILFILVDILLCLRCWITQLFMWRHSCQTDLLRFHYRI